ncbi:MAG: hypothetical protein ACI85U_002502, partial [Candidatus Promineifilaceae bacterium]
VSKLQVGKLQVSISTLSPNWTMFITCNLQPST